MRTCSIFLLSLALFTGCSASRKEQLSPELYPSQELARRNPADVQRDIDECGARAADYVKAESAGATIGKVVLSALEGAVVGTAGGALAGTIANGRAGTGAGAGAAVGGLTGAYGALKEIGKVSPREREFIKACLEERGYKVLGWESEK